MCVTKCVACDLVPGISLLWKLCCFYESSVNNFLMMVMIFYSTKVPPRWKEMFYKMDLLMRSLASILQEVKWFKYNVVLNWRNSLKVPETFSTCYKNFCANMLPYTTRAELKYMHSWQFISGCLRKISNTLKISTEVSISKTKIRNSVMTNCTGQRLTSAHNGGSDSAYNLGRNPISL